MIFTLAAEFFSIPGSLGFAYAAGRSKEVTAQEETDDQG